MSLKKFLFAITLISIAIVISIAGYLFFAKRESALAQTANYHYIRDGANGTGSGADWTNAYTSLPATLVRGDIYYIADGSYAGFTINSSSGTNYTYIKKATISDHGTESGWDNVYGDGQAVFSNSWLIFNHDYLIFDGATGAGADVDSYGFKVNPPTNCSQSTYLVQPRGNYQTISHVAIINCGSSYNYTQNGIYAVMGSNNLTIANCYFKNSGASILIRSLSDSIISDNYFDGNWTSAAQHGGHISPGSSCANIVIKNNLFKNTRGTGAIGVHRSNNRDFKIFNNIMVETGSSTTGFFVGNTDDPSADVLINFEVHHNTVINANLGGAFGFFEVGNLTDVFLYKSYSYNNLFYNCLNCYFGNGGVGDPAAIVHSHNTAFDYRGTFHGNEGGTVQVSSGDPFLNFANNDFHLKGATNNGLTLSFPFDKDFFGNARGADGVWDRGAYEYIQSSPPLKGDFNSDKKVNDLDFTDFKNAFKSIFNSIFDLNSDNAIDVKDLGVLMSGWLE